MKLFKFNEMKDGWFVGHFSPSCFNTDKFEVCYKTHKKGEQWDTHFHAIATEINLLIQGRMTINSELLIGGDIFVIEPYEISSPVFLEDCTLIIIKTPSIPNDKYLC